MHRGFLFAECPAPSRRASRAVILVADSALRHDPRSRKCQWRLGSRGISSVLPARAGSLAGIKAADVRRARRIGGRYAEAARRTEAMSAPG